MKIELKHLEKKFPDAAPISDVNAVINDGDIIAVIGPSGTGKSTLLRCINMLDPPTGGQIFIDGIEITNNKANFGKLRRKIGMVFQSFNLFSHLTVIENIMLALTELKKMSRQEAYDIAIEQLQKVGLADKALAYPEELSGGMKQRVSIARTLAMDPELILLDEPTSALDPTMVREVESVICNLAKTGKTMVIVTHEMRLAKAISNRIFYLDRGVIYEDGTPEQVFNNPQRERTRAFVNNLKVFKYRFKTNNFSYDDYASKFSEYIENNELEAMSKASLRSVMEHIATEFVPNHMSQNDTVSIVAELNPESKKVKMLVYYSSNSSDNLTEMTAILSPLVSTITTESIEDEDFDFKAVCMI